MALEIAEDRRHLLDRDRRPAPDGLVLLDLAAHLDGTEPTTTALQLREQQTVIAVLSTPHSNPPTAIRPLEAADVKVTRPTSGDIAKAHGLFSTSWPPAASATSARPSSPRRCGTSSSAAWAAPALPSAAAPGRRVAGGGRRAGRLGAADESSRR